MTYDRVNFSEAKVKNFPRFIRLPSGAETQITSLWKYVGNRVTTTMTFDPVLNSGTINASATKDHAGPPTPINDLELLKYDFKFKYVESNYEVESDNANGWAGAWKWEVEIARVHPLIGSIYTYSTTSETRPAAPLVVDPPPVGTHLDWIFQFFPSQVPGDLQLWSSQHPLPVSCNFSEWDYDYIFQGEIV